MYYDWKDLLMGLLVGLAYVIVSLVLVFTASVVWHFGEICLRGWI